MRILDRFRKKNQQVPVDSSPLDDCTLYDFDKKGIEIHQLHDLYITVGMNQKYFAYRLKRYQFWNRTFDIFIVLATLAAIVISANEIEDLFTLNAVKVLGPSFLAAAFALCRPFFKVSTEIHQCEKIHEEYTNLYYNLKRIEEELWIRPELDEATKKELTRYRERVTKIATQEELVPNRKRLESFRNEFLEEIGYDTCRLFLPGKNDNDNKTEERPETTTEGTT
jgi:hypothetical protein